jgi:hypothetical protein
MLQVFFDNDQLIAILKEKKHFHRDRAEKIIYKHKQTALIFCGKKGIASKQLAPRFCHKLKSSKSNKKYQF